MYAVSEEYREAMHSFEIRFMENSDHLEKPEFEILFILVHRDCADACTQNSTVPTPSAQ